MSDYRHKRHNVSALLYHIVCPAKYRRVIFDPEVDAMLKDICLDIAQRYELAFLEIGTDKDRVSKNAIFGLNFLPGFWTRQISWIMLILTGFGPHPRGPKSGQGKLADSDTLT